jgi:iron complex outermembrane recepter protein
MRAVHSTSRLPACLSVAATTLVLSAVHAETAAEGDQPKVEEVVVTGSYLRSARQADLASPTQVLDADALARTGAPGLDRIINNEPANLGSVGGVQDLDGGGQDNRASRSANLRGLGPASTLVLLNGRRVASQESDALGNNYVNLASLVPMIGIERVETVLDGASALYGSDAIAGVINIITDERFEGLATSAQYTHIEDAPGYVAQIKVGGGGERVHTVASLSYEFQDNLQNADREVTNFLNTSGSSQPGNFILSARPRTASGGDVIIDNGVNGPINYSQLYDRRVAATGSPLVQVADPHCTVQGTGGIFAPRAAGAQFPDGACRFSFQAQNPIKPESKLLLGHLSSTYELSDAHELFLETRYYRQSARRFGVSSVPLSNGSPIVPASNPFNPFGVNVTFSGRVLGVNGDYLVQKPDITGTHVVLGARGDISDRWGYTADVIYSEDVSSTTSLDTDLLLLQHALNGFGGRDCRVSFTGPAASEVPGQGNCVYFSPFGANQLSNDPRVGFNLLSPVQTRAEVGHQLAEFVINGELFDLPAGSLGIAFGAQRREDKTDVRFDDFIQSGRAAFAGRSFSGTGDRTVTGVFVELGVPVLSSLDVQLAARYEDYGEFTTADPKIGINWRATDNFSLRASGSTAFRAPALSQSASTATTSGTGQTRDPLDPTDTGTFRVINRVNNPDLRPEESRNFNVGVTWEAIERLSLSADYWSFKFQDQIAAESADQVLLRDPNGPQAIRDQLGRLLAVNVGYFNSGETQTSGVDLKLAYDFELFGMQHWSIRNNLTWIDRYEVQIGPGQPVVDGVGRRNSNNPGYPTPQWRDNLTVAWEYDRSSASVTMRYTDSVLDDVFLPIAAVPVNEIGSWTVFDVQLQQRFGAGDKTKLTIGAINAFDRAPPSATFTGYLSGLADALGRQAYIRLEHSL